MAFAITWQSNYIMSLTVTRLVIRVTFTLKFVACHSASSLRGRAGWPDWAQDWPHESDQSSGTYSLTSVQASDAQLAHE